VGTWQYKNTKRGISLSEELDQERAAESSEYDDGENDAKRVVGFFNGVSAIWPRVTPTGVRVAAVRHPASAPPTLEEYLAEREGAVVARAQRSDVYVRINELKGLRLDAAGGPRERTRPRQRSKPFACA
jgi:hypothetical protein